MKYSLKKIILPSSEEIEIESAQLRDSDSLWHLGYTVAQDHEFQATYPDEFNIKIEDEPTFIKACEEDPRKLALVAHNIKGEIVGLSTLMPVSRLRKMQHISMTTIALLPTYRDKKLGQILMSETLEAAKSSNEIEKVELRVLSSNLRAIALYKKLGFKEVGRLQNEFKFGPNDYRDDVLMELLL